MYSHLINYFFDVLWFNCGLTILPTCVSTVWGGSVCLAEILLLTPCNVIGFKYNSSDIVQLLCFIVCLWELYIRYAYLESLLWYSDLYTSRTHWRWDLCMWYYVLYAYFMCLLLHLSSPHAEVCWYHYTQNEIRISMTFCTSGENNANNRSTQSQSTNNHHYCHSTHEKTSSGSTATGLKALPGSLGLTTSSKKCPVAKWPLVCDMLDEFIN